MQVAEKIQEELEDYRSKEDDIKRMKHEMGVEGESDFAIGMLSDNTQVKFFNDNWQLLNEFGWLLCIRNVVNLQLNQKVSNLELCDKCYNF